jgi:TrmH family RNA methyltransferase
MITSIHNPRIQWVRKLQRQPRFRATEGVFVVEGVRLVEEAWQAGWQPELVLYTPALSPRGLDLLRRLAPPVAEQVSPAILQSASDTQAPQGILAVLPQRSLPLPGSLSFVLLLDAVRDPGNLGTILRTAAAAGVQGVLLTPGSADPYSPKVIRSAMGAHFRLPVLPTDWEGIRRLLKPGASQPGLRVFLTDAKGGAPYTQVNFTSPAAFIIGGEAEGAGDDAQNLADQRVYIPMQAGIESLNAAVAAAILMFEVVRQRKL